MAGCTACSINWRQKQGVRLHRSQMHRICQRMTKYVLALFVIRQTHSTVYQRAATQMQSLPYFQMELCDISAMPALRSASPRMRSNASSPAICQVQSCVSLQNSLTLRRGSLLSIKVGMYTRYLQKF